MLQIISPRSIFLAAVTTLAVPALITLGCGGDATERPAPELQSAEPRPTTAPDTGASVRIVVLGDSIAAGLGLAEDAAFPARVEASLRDLGHDVEVVNAGVSGDTSAGGLARLDWVLQKPAAILVVELGGNDALRGHPLESTETNLTQIVSRGQQSGAEVILLGMDVPTNYGPDYTAAFAELYPRIAEDTGATLVPGFVRELGADPTLLQPDGLHPTAEGQQRLADTLLPALVEVIERRQEQERLFVDPVAGAAR
ncbi:MAG: arylesterase [Candidatus Sulfomarinibacteraceae bacterium]